MKLTTNYRPLLSRFAPAFDAASDDVVKEAQRIAPKRSGKYSRSIRKQALPAGDNQRAAIVGSSMSSARVKEKGGFIQAQSASGLLIHLPGGQYRTVQSVHVSAQPTVVPAGDKFAELMTRRLREAAGG